MPAASPKLVRKQRARKMLYTVKMGGKRIA